jgi:spermidine/putrescine transport system permease protein
MNRPTIAWKLYIAAFYIFLFAPLLIVAIFAFNASPFPSPPWRGFTLEWFTGSGTVFGKPGVLMDSIWLSSIGNSFKVAVPVALLAVLLGTVNAWVLERAEFRGKTVLAMMMLWPLVIPGVVLGISILAFFSRVANGLEDWLQTDLDFLRPGLPLVILGQLSFILTISTSGRAARGCCAP